MKLGIVVCIFIVLIVTSFFIVKEFISSLLASMVFAYLFHPLYKKVNKKINRPAISALIVTVLVGVLFIVPILFISQGVIGEVRMISRSGIINQAVDRSSRILGSNPTLDVGISDVVSKVTAYMITYATNFVIALPGKIIDFVLFLYVLFHLLMIGESFGETVRDALPLKNKDRLLGHLGATTYAIMYGLFVIALMEFVIALIVFKIIGMSAPFLWAFIIFITALIPFVGPSVVWVPLAIFKGLNREMFAAGTLILMGVILLYVDTLVRTRIISGKAKMHPVMLLLGLIGGISVFGPIGIIVGPLVLSFLTVIVQEYYRELVQSD